jgi:hypothetical protein
MKEKAHEGVSFDLDFIAKEHPAPVAPPPKTGDGKVVQTNTVVVNAGQEQKGPSAGKTVANIFLGVGLTAAVIGGAFIGVSALLAKDKGNDCAQLPGNSNSWVCAHGTASNIETAQTLNTVGLVTAIVGGALAVTGIVLLIALPKDKEKENRPQVSFAPVPGGGAFMALGGRF